MTDFCSIIYTAWPLTGGLLEYDKGKQQSQEIKRKREGCVIMLLFLKSILSFLSSNERIKIDVEQNSIKLVKRSGIAVQ